jgi:hypothetical protein
MLLKILQCTEQHTTKNFWLEMPKALRLRNLDVWCPCETLPQQAGVGPTGPDLGCSSPCPLGSVEIGFVTNTASLRTRDSPHSRALLLQMLECSLLGSTGPDPEKLGFQTRSCQQQPLSSPWPLLLWQTLGWRATRMQGYQAHQVLHSRACPLHKPRHPLSWPGWRGCWPENSPEVQTRLVWL